MTDKKKNLLFKSFLIAAVVSLLIAVLFLSSGVSRISAYLSSDGIEKKEEGTLYEKDNHVGELYTNGKMVTYAPDPKKEFRDVDCSLSSEKKEKPMKSMGWSIPAIGESAKVSYSGYDNSPFTIPDAPDGTMYASDAKLEDLNGAVLQAGHVDYSPGTLSAEGGELSPWGKLHSVKECDHVYSTDEKGKIHEFVITDLYTIPQKEFSSTRELFRKDGPKSLYLITCSGKSVGDDGNSSENRMNFRYEYNLIVKAKAIS